MGVTLKQAVESGRRWRLTYENGEPSRWLGPGSEPFTLSVRQALSDIFQIEPEPEPEKPREWTMDLDQHGGLHCDACESRDHRGWKPLRVHDADACDKLHRENP